MDRHEQPFPRPPSGVLPFTLKKPNGEFIRTSFGNNGPTTLAVVFAVTTSLPSVVTLADSE
jgi:hypothetical protein